MMYKVMLVDDEMLVRLGVKSLIQWEEHGFRFMGDAPDGAKALELMSDGPPDILLTDIVMPNMNGLELIEKVKVRYPDTLIIVLSSHNEFEYVRKAMKMGIEDYLLKTSLKPSELLQLLIEAKGKLQRKIERRSEQQANGAYHERTPETMNRLLAAALNNEESDFWGEMETVLPGYSYLLLLHVKGIREGVPQHSASGLLKHLVEAELQGMLHAGPIQTGEREMAAMLTVHEENIEKLQARIDNLANASGSLLGISLNGYTSGPISRWRETGGRMVELQEMADASKTKEASRDDIKKLLEYMNKHYDQNLSLRTAAGMVNMSEAYLSTVFKKETGTNFTDWLNMLRIEKASSLLIDTDLPSYLISEQVGYENSNYFGRIFNKMKGISPQKYRSLNGKKECERFHEKIKK